MFRILVPEQLEDDVADMVAQVASIVGRKPPFPEEERARGRACHTPVDPRHYGHTLLLIP
jgi:hypothetical protein